MTYSYIAGFFDGEGHVSLIPSIHRCALSLTQSTKQDRVLFEIQAFLREEGIPSQIHHPQLRGAQLPVRHLLITNAAAIAHCLERMLPFLIVKRSAAEQALSYVKNVLARRRFRQERGQQWIVEYKAGDSTITIARRHAVTPAAIKWTLKKYGVPIRDKHVARKMFQPSPEFLAARRADFHRGRDIRWAARRAELQPIIEKCLAEYAKGATMQALKDKYGIDQRFLRKRLITAGLFPRRHRRRTIPPAQATPATC